MVTDVKDLFFLDPEVIFLNHGSFGACPRPVFDVYQAWQAKLERQPVEFLGRRAADLLADARVSLASFLAVAPDTIVYFPNPTTAINMIARSLDLQSGDEILATNHEYGAMDRAWQFICNRRGAQYIRLPIPLPATNRAEIVETFWEGVNPRTKAIFISHVTSSTALTFPVQEICLRARQSGILSIVDGAHAPGQIHLNLAELGADLYTGACHKWLCAPKGAAFLYARREVQSWLDPLVVSWGYQSESPSQSQFIDYHEWQGTRDLAAFLSVPAAIEFQAQYHWEEVRLRCHELLCQTLCRIQNLTGLPTVYPGEPDFYHQMAVTPLPYNLDSTALKKRLYDDFRIEVPLIEWNRQKFLRISVQGYNTQEDLDALVKALERLLAHQTTG